MQTENLERVKSNIGELVTKFVVDRWHQNAPYFTSDDLRQYIACRVTSAPASPDRILRYLRRQGKFDYQVVNRRASEYQILGIGGSRVSEKTRTVKLLYQGKVVDHFQASGKRIRLPRHIVDHIFSSSEFEIQVC